MSSEVPVEDIAAGAVKGSLDWTFEKIIFILSKGDSQ